MNIKCKFCNGSKKHSIAGWIMFSVDILFSVFAFSIGCWMPFYWYNSFPDEGFPWVGILGLLMMWCLSFVGVIMSLFHLHGQCAVLD